MHTQICILPQSHIHLLSTQVVLHINPSIKHFQTHVIKELTPHYCHTLKFHLLCFAHRAQFTCVFGASSVFVYGLLMSYLPQVTFIPSSAEIL